jgi:hypothetical protein
MFRISNSTSRYNLNRYSSSKIKKQKNFFFLFQKQNFLFSQFLGHEYPYAIKMKHLKTSLNNTSFDNDDHSSLQSTSTLYSHHHSSTTSLNNISINSHDFELRKRDTDNQNKKHRFFHKRKPKDNYTKPPIQQQQQQQSNDDNYSSTPIRTKSSYQFFGQTLDELIKKSNNQLPSVIQQLLEILYFKGPETTGIFRKVANTRSVRESIDKIERNICLQNEDLHPILAAGIFKVSFTSIRKIKTSKKKCQ